MRFLLSLARSSIGKFVIGWIFEHMSFAIPVKRLYETDTLLAFYHPRPNYPVHILLVSKKGISSLMDVTQDDDPFLEDVFRTAQILVERLNLADSGYRLILNGGEYQEVPQLHFHLISGEDLP